MIATLKRRLGPFRPVLAPPYRLLRGLVREDGPWSVPNVAERLQARARGIARTVRGQPGAPIRALSHVELLDLAIREPYYKPRREYLGAGAAVAAELIARRDLTTALELGPHLRSLIVGADVMDVHVNERLHAEGRRIVHDATRTPWPISDKAYDLFVAFQVFEHLGIRQPEAFREVRRVARHAILSLPIDWDMADPTNCHYRLSEATVLGWFAPVVPSRIVVGNPGHRKRLLFVFEDLPPPDGREAATTAGTELAANP